MPAAPRSKGVARKVFIKVMGVPQNEKNIKSAKKKKVNKRLVFEETSLVR